MGVTNYSWGPSLQEEADKCWFYAISFSILSSLYHLSKAFSATTGADARQNEHTTSKQEDKSQTTTHDAIPVNASKYRALLIQLVIDFGDLTIPGASLGWIPIQMAVVGAAQFISSALAGQRIWRRVQSSA